MKLSQTIQRFIVAFALCIIPMTGFGNCAQGYCQTECCEEVEFNAYCEPCWHFYADLLYWRANVVNLPFAVLGNIASVPVDTSEFVFANNEFAASVPFNYTPGFRIGIGKELDCCVDLTADWTRFHTSALFSKVPGPDDLIQVIWTLNLPATIATLDASQSLHYDTASIDFTKHFPLNSFILHPFIGAIGAIINQHLSIATKQLFDDGIVGFDTVKIKNDFAGGGPQIGLLFEYLPCCDFSLYTKGSYSLLYGKFKIAVQDRDQILFSNSSVTFPHNQGTLEFALAHAFDLNIGLKYLCSLFHKRLQFHLGYECVYWPGQVRVPRIQSADLAGKNRNADLFNAQGDLCMHGLTTGFEFYY